MQLYLGMSQTIFLVVFQLLYTSQIFGIEHCNRNERFKSFFDVAVEFINKANSYFPDNLILPGEESCPPMDCEEILRSGHNYSGVYTVWPRSRVTDGKPIEVYCDMDTDDGGWTVIQRRGNFNRSVDYFFKEWSSYKNGFGDIKEDFWLGNDKIFALTNQRAYSIRFDLKDVKGEKRHALYDIFWIDNESLKYKLHIKDYSGNAGDSMTERHANQKFSTKDQDNDASKRDCSQTFKGAWWYGDCYRANLNGLYLRGPHANDAGGLIWYTFRNYNESLDTTEMKIRPANFKRKLVTNDTS
ncbi:unnamed protein product [Larinioides sclopetarius]|uniref:Fibrinogen C-terminal domain-containing protein n=2 Tax=Larinioides sclopetarius TaxID=280406 RepID=A0AAV2A5S7_9ARAC